MFKINKTQKFYPFVHSHKVEFHHPNGSCVYKGEVQGRTENNTYLISIPRGMILINLENDYIKIIQADRQEIEMKSHFVDNLKLISSKGESYNVYIQNNRLEYKYVVETEWRELIVGEKIPDGRDSYTVAYVSEEVIVLTDDDTKRDRCFSFREHVTLSSVGIKVE